MLHSASFMDESMVLPFKTCTYSPFYCTHFCISKKMWIVQPSVLPYCQTLVSGSSDIWPKRLSIPQPHKVTENNEKCQPSPETQLYRFAENQRLQVHIQTRILTPFSIGKHSKFSMSAKCSSATRVKEWHLANIQE